MLFVSKTDHFYERRCGLAVSKLAFCSGGVGLILVRADANFSDIIIFIFRIYFSRTWYILIKRCFSETLRRGQEILTSNYNFEQPTLNTCDF